MLNIKYQYTKDIYRKVYIIGIQCGTKEQKLFQLSNLHVTLSTYNFNYAL